VISVVIPAYNAARALGACLRALDRQSVSHGEYEVIVVDDGSTDETASVAEAAGARVVRIPHGGPASARNAGLAAVAGELILFTDADCEPASNWIAEMTRPFADPDVVGVKGAYRTRQRQVIARLAQCEFEERYARLERLPCIDFVDSYSAAFRVQALRQIGGYDPAFPYPNNEDVDLSYRLSRAGCKLVFNRQALVYHCHRTSWDAYLRLKVKRGYWRMVVYRLHPGKAVQDSYTPQLLKVQVFLACLCVGLVLAALIWPALWWAVGGSLVLLAASSIPFTRLVWRQDPSLAPWSPIFIWGRALAFGIGVMGGLVGMLFFRRALKTG
jgi:cellulose synthase/poly-beta-1,6-N-acetylglucosamine synthase-like glycosyltransferase